MSGARTARRSGAGLLVAVLALLLAAPAAARDSAYLDALLARAERDGLAEHRRWIALGHYLPNLIGNGWRGVIDSPGFFIAAEGKTDPAAELAATLRAFFAADHATINDQHPQCAFPARYDWLKAKLDFDPARLPDRACPRFEAWFQAIDPHQVTLVFPSAYMNQPSSMFGHTLLRIDRPGQAGQSPLTAYAINYGAATGSDGGVVFAFKGLAGGYPGHFSIMPYYEKVKDYSDLENRDIWEYRLNFQPDEIRLMLRHVWELGQEYADYYFFDENCSYHLLSLLEVARPELDLTSEYRWWAIPTDTVRSVVARAGLLQEAVYRPSARREIDHRLGLIDAQGRDLAYGLSQGDLALDDPRIAALPPEGRAAVLDLAYEYLQYQFHAGDRDRDEAAPLSLALLRARSGIDGVAPTPPVPEPDVRPDQGHESARLSAGLGRIDGRDFVELALRPAYHDLLDPPGGYLPGTQIDFLNIVLRHFRRSGTVSLEEVSLVDIRSVSPRNKFFRPVSWRLRTGVERFRRGGEADNDVVGVAAGGAGLAYPLFGDKVLASAFADLDLLGAPDLPDTVLVDIGPSLGLLVYATPRWTLNLQGEYRFALDGSSEDAFLAGLEQSLTLTPALAFRLTTAYRGPADNPFTEIRGALHWYF